MPHNCIYISDMIPDIAVTSPYSHWVDNKALLFDNNDTTCVQGGEWKSNLICLLWYIEGAVVTDNKMGRKQIWGEKGKTMVEFKLQEVCKSLQKN